MEPVRDYELRAFFSYVIEVLERLGIPYMVVGGFAAIFYGEPRLTIDVDIVVAMQLKHLPGFVAAFPIPDYYISEEGICDSLQRRYPFNVIEPGTGAKVDLVPLPTDPFTQAAFQRRQRLAYDEEMGQRHCGSTPCADLYLTDEESILLATTSSHTTLGGSGCSRESRQNQYSSMAIGRQWQASPGMLCGSTQVAADTENSDDFLSFRGVSMGRKGALPLHLVLRRAPPHLHPVVARAGRVKVDADRGLVQLRMGGE